MKLTTLEKKTIISMINDGFFWDDETGRFITWGVSGQDKAGCLTSLNKKGVVRVYTEADGFDGTAIYCGDNITKKDLLNLCGWFDLHPEDLQIFENL